MRWGSGTSTSAVTRRVTGTPRARRAQRTGASGRRPRRRRAHRRRRQQHDEGETVGRVHRRLVEVVGKPLGGRVSEPDSCSDVGESTIRDLRPVRASARQRRRSHRRQGRGCGHAHAPANNEERRDDPGDRQDRDAQSGDARSAVLSASESSRRSRKENQNALEERVDAPIDATRRAPVWKKLTTNQKDPRANRPHRRPERGPTATGLAGEYKDASAGSANAAVRFVPRARASASAESASSARELPIAKYAQIGEGRRRRGR